MSKYVKGSYKVKANEEAFEKFSKLQGELNLIKGLVQNDMTISHEDLEFVEETIKDITTILHTIFEDAVAGAVHQGENQNEIS